MLVPSNPYLFPLKVDSLFVGYFSQLTTSIYPPAFEQHHVSSACVCSSSQVAFHSPVFQNNESNFDLSRGCPCAPVAATLQLMANEVLGCVASGELPQDQQSFVLATIDVDDWKKLILFLVFFMEKISFSEKDRKSLCMSWLMPDDGWWTPYPFAWHN